MAKISRFWPYLAAVPFVLGLLAYSVVSYRVADGITKLARGPLVPSADVVSKTHEDVSFRATDGLLLKGWWFPTTQAPVNGVRGGPIATPADKAVVFVHGRGQNRIASSFGPDKIAPIFLARGWNVLLFDLRGHGEREGERYSLGQYEPRDIIAAINFAAEKVRHPQAAGRGHRRIARRGQRDHDRRPRSDHRPDRHRLRVRGHVHRRERGRPELHRAPVMVHAGHRARGKLFFGLDVASVKPVEVVRSHPERACGHVQAFTEHPAEWQQHVLTFLDREIGRAQGATSR